MCSSTLGPAICPSFVTWPTSSTAVPLVLAKRTSSAVHSRNCETAPGADSIRSEYMVCMESTIRTRAARLDPALTISSTQVSASSRAVAASSPKRRARSATCLKDSSPVA